MNMTRVDKHTQPELFVHLYTNLIVSIGLMLLNWYHQNVNGRHNMSEIYLILVYHLSFLIYHILFSIMACFILRIMMRLFYPFSNMKGTIFVGLFTINRPSILVNGSVHQGGIKGDGMQGIVDLKELSNYGSIREKLNIIFGYSFTIYLRFPFDLVLMIMPLPFLKVTNIIVNDFWYIISWRNIECINLQQNANIIMKATYNVVNWFSKVSLVLLGSTCMLTFTKIENLSLSCTAIPFHRFSIQRIKHLSWIKVLQS